MDICNIYTMYVYIYNMFLCTIFDIKYKIKNKQSIMYIIYSLIFKFDI